MTRRDQDYVERMMRRSRATSMLMGQGIDNQMHKDIVISLSVSLAKRMKLLPAEWSDEKCLLALHKYRYELKHAPDEKRHESRAWLEARGFHRLQNAPWPPEGELPK